MTIGYLRCSPDGYDVSQNSHSGKWFAETPEDAAKWGEIMNGPGKSTVVRAELPTGQANQMMRMERLDGIGPARYDELNQLEGVTIKW
ncbi:hypothetical protein C7U60_09930 [Mesorhizobium plurifarium]|uniref:hypothetical protein n=1 Tax=Sinorhizobium arboris TaxID=76745 RepID=UPI00048211FF|nr:hypothetical protein [Sinorhizobium arboris]PST24219.1 hypothetical protein C7U60_09930 [Mesorhizobium plurifarium]